jgi:CubicO group peptidase (beta-lactamase class C family)
MPTALSRWHFGWADVDRRIPVSTAHLFQIGSISKAFAALTIFHLSDAGKIDLDAPLAKYLPDAMLPEDTDHGGAGAEPHGRLGRQRAHFSARGRRTAVVRLQAGNVSPTATRAMSFWVI